MENNIVMLPDKIEGYWHSRYEPHYPMPIPNVLTQTEADTIFDLIKKKESVSVGHQFRGFSMSRIEPTVVVGSREYEKNGWIWPDGFAEHYVKKHRVKPTDKFLKFIGYEQTD